MAETPSDQPGIGGLFARLGVDARRAWRAHLALARAQFSVRFAAARLGIVAALLALFLLPAVFCALLVGMVLTLSPCVGPGWATLIVVVASLAVIALLGWFAAGRFANAASSDPK